LGEDAARRTFQPPVRAQRADAEVQVADAAGVARATQAAELPAGTGTVRGTITAPSWQKRMIRAVRAAVARLVRVRRRGSGFLESGEDGMVERQGSRPGAVPPPPGWMPPAGRPPVPSPSGLFPGHPPRPEYREPHPVTAAPVLAGIGATLLWFALFGSIGRDLLSYAWWTVVAAVTAWAVALVLALLGDRGVAVGVALTGGLGLSVAAFFVGERWIMTNQWPMW
jgi:hypothetical protein